MNIWIIYSLFGLLTGGLAIVAFLFFRSKIIGKREEFDASRDLFI